MTRIRFVAALPGNAQRDSVVFPCALPRPRATRRSPHHADEDVLAAARDARSRIALRRIQSYAEYAVVCPQHTVRDLPDPDDAPFAECAPALGCDLVSGNKRHFPRAAIEALTVLSPRQFVATV